MCRSIYNSNSLWHLYTYFGLFIFFVYIYIYLHFKTIFINKRAKFVSSSASIVRVKIYFFLKFMKLMWFFSFDRLLNSVFWPFFTLRQTARQRKMVIYINWCGCAAWTRVPRIDVVFFCACTTRVDESRSSIRLDELECENPHVYNFVFPLYMLAKIVKRP